jgi:hypothetical protein
MQHINFEVDMAEDYPIKLIRTNDRDQPVRGDVVSCPTVRLTEASVKEYSILWLGSGQPTEGEGRMGELLQGRVVVVIAGASAGMGLGVSTLCATEDPRE